MLRKFLVLLIVALFGIQLNAQIQFDGEGDVYYGSIANVGEEVQASWDVINASDQTLELSCRRYALQEVPGADGNFCWGLLCIAWSTGHYNASNPDDAVFLAPGESNHSFKAKYRHHGIAGQGIYRYCIYERNDLVDDLCQIVNFCVDAECLVSTENMELEASGLQISPNPIDRVGNITYKFKQAPNNGMLIVYNTVGMKVKEIKLNSREGIVYLGASEFQSGIYFCSIEDNGQVQQTARMIIQ